MKYAGFTFSVEQIGVPRRLEAFVCEIENGRTTVLEFKKLPVNFSAAVEIIQPSSPQKVFYPNEYKARYLKAFELIKADLVRCMIPDDVTPFLQLLGSEEILADEESTRALPEATMKLLSVAHTLLTAPHPKRYQAQTRNNWGFQGFSRTNEKPIALRKPQ